MRFCRWFERRLSGKKSSHHQRQPPHHEAADHDAALSSKLSIVSSVEQSLIFSVRDAATVNSNNNGCRVAEADSNNNNNNNNDNSNIGAVLSGDGASAAAASHSWRSMAAGRQRRCSNDDATSVQSWTRKSKQMPMPPIASQLHRPSQITGTADSLPCSPSLSSFIATPNSGRQRSRIKTNPWLRSPWLLSKRSSCESQPIIMPTSPSSSSECELNHRCDGIATNTNGNRLPAATSLLLISDNSHYYGDEIAAAAAAAARRINRICKIGRGSRDDCDGGGGNGNSSKTQSTGSPRISDRSANRSNLVNQRLTANGFMAATAAVTADAPSLSCTNINHRRRRRLRRAGSPTICDNDSVRIMTTVATVKSVPVVSSGKPQSAAAVVVDSNGVGNRKVANLVTGGHKMINIACCKEDYANQRIYHELLPPCSSSDEFVSSRSSTSSLCRASSSSGSDNQADHGQISDQASGMTNCCRCSLGSQPSLHDTGSSVFSADVKPSAVDLWRASCSHHHHHSLQSSETITVSSVDGLVHQSDQRQRQRLRRRHRQRHRCSSQNNYHQSESSAMPSNQLQQEQPAVASVSGVRAKRLPKNRCNNSSQPAVEQTANGSQLQQQQQQRQRQRQLGASIYSRSARFDRNEEWVSTATDLICLTSTGTSSGLSSDDRGEEEEEEEKENGRQLMTNSTALLLSRQSERLQRRKRSKKHSCKLPVSVAVPAPVQRLSASPMLCRLAKNCNKSIESSVTTDTERKVTGTSSTRQFDDRADESRSVYVPSPAPEPKEISWLTATSYASPRKSANIFATLPSSSPSSSSPFCRSSTSSMHQPSAGSSSPSSSSSSSSPVTMANGSSPNISAGTVVSRSTHHLVSARRSTIGSNRFKYASLHCESSPIHDHHNSSQFSLISPLTADSGIGLSESSISTTPSGEDYQHQHQLSDLKPGTAASTVSAVSSNALTSMDYCLSDRRASFHSLSSQTIANTQSSSSSSSIGSKLSLPPPPPPPPSLPSVADGSVVSSTSSSSSSSDADQATTTATSASSASPATAVRMAVAAINDNDLKVLNGKVDRLRVELKDIVNVAIKEARQEELKIREEKLAYLREMIELKRLLLLQSLDDIKHRIEHTGSGTGNQTY